MSKLHTVIALSLVSLSACGTAQITRMDAAGGHVQLEGHYMPAMGEAHILMSEHCGSPYVTLERGHDVEFRCRQQNSRMTLAKR